MNKILVPVDFSITSQNALSYAIKLFGRTETEITVLHAYAADQSTFQMKSDDSVLHEGVANEMKALMEKVKNEKWAISLNSKIVNGEAVSTIARLGNSGAYDFIIMGTKGASGLKQVFVGSVAGGVIASTSTPVLVVPDNYIYHPLNEIVVAISGMPFSSDASIAEPLRKIANIQSAKVTVLHVAEGKALDMEGVLTAIEDLNPSVAYAFGVGNINQRLNDYLMESEAGILCLVRRKKGFFDRLFGVSVTMKQTFDSPVPLLILHN